MKRSFSVQTDMHLLSFRALGEIDHPFALEFVSFPNLFERFSIFANPNGQSFRARMKLFVRAILQQQVRQSFWLAQANGHTGRFGVMVGVERKIESFTACRGQQQM